jgi:hypothetical protein
VTKANGVAQKSQSKLNAHGPQATKKATPPKLNDRQREFLKKIKEAGEPGYEASRKVEQRTIDALVERKLVKRGSKNKETGNQRYLLTKAGETHMPPAAPIAASAEPPPTPTSSPDQPAV